MKILVADDNDEVRQYVCAVLEDAGYETLEASDGKQALVLCRTQPVSLMVTDLCMPEQDGIETICALAKEGNPIKILAMSGAMGGVYLSVVKKLGASAVLRKPIDAEELLSAVAELLKTP